MTVIRKLLEHRNRQLHKLIEEKREALKGAPEGSLRVGNSTRAGAQLYYREKAEDKNGRYLQKKEGELAARLAQKDYDLRIVQAAEKEIKIIKPYLTKNAFVCAEEVYGRLPKVRQALVRPVEEPEEKYVERWLREEYEGKEFAEDAPDFITDQGERVRSKSEIIIANILRKNGVPYRYEKPHKIQGLGVVYPDFTVLDVKHRREVLWEHLGMMDDPLYAQAAVRKLTAYALAGYYPGERLVLTWETGEQPLNMKVVQKTAEKYTR